MKILILGANGILGHSIFLYLSKISSIEVLGLSSHNSSKSTFYKEYFRNLKLIDLLDFDNLVNSIQGFKPNVVINCAVKKNINPTNSDIIDSIIINSILPQKLSFLSEIHKFRFIHISTDSVFGNNFFDKSENEIYDIKDLYSASKALGEPDGKYTITLRTSLIGHSLNRNNGLLDSILNSVEFNGFSDAIFAGTTSLEIAKIIYYIIINNENINSGIYHISGSPISKYDLAVLVKEIYNLEIKINKVPGENVIRKLSSSKFSKIYNYTVPSWNTLLKDLKEFYQLNKSIYE